MAVSFGILQFTAGAGITMVYSPDLDLDVGVRNDSGMCGRNRLVLDPVASGEWRQPVVVLCVRVQFCMYLDWSIFGGRLEEGHSDGATAL